MYAICSNLSIGIAFVNNLIQNSDLLITDHYCFTNFGKFIQRQDCHFDICIAFTLGLVNT